MLTRLILTTTFCALSFFIKAQTWGTKKDDIVFTSVETAPKYPGGLSAFYQFVAENLKFPDKKFAMFSNKSLTLNIIIDDTGNPIYAEIEKGINEEYNNAALSIVSKMPKWTSALQNGRPVNVWVRIPLIFID
jgi:hypothetical protein